MNIVSKVCDYILSKGSWFFVGWTREALEDYILFHLQQQTISVATDKFGNVGGIMIGWQQHGSKHIPFRWQHTDQTGDVWWWDQFMADSPSAASAIAIDFCERWPMASRLPGVGFRNGKLRKYPIGSLLKIYKKAQSFYGHIH